MQYYQDGNCYSFYSFCDILYIVKAKSEIKVPNINRKQNQNGFSVIEVIITLFMIGVSMMLFQSTANSIVLNKFGRYKEVALRIADKKIQTVRTTPFANIPATGTFTDSALSSLPNGQATMTVSSPTATLKDVAVTITWDTPNGNGTQQVELQTFIYEGGLGQ